MARLGISLGTFGALMTFSCGHMLEHVAFECPGIPTLLTTLCTLIFGIFNMFAPEMSLQLLGIGALLPTNCADGMPRPHPGQDLRGLFLLVLKAGVHPQSLECIHLGMVGCQHSVHHLLTGPQLFWTCWDRSWSWSCTGGRLTRLSLRPLRW